VDWDVAVAQARSEVEGAELDALLAYDAFIRDPVVDPMWQALRTLSVSGKKRGGGQTKQ
jgi:hypothetical protein